MLKKDDDAGGDCEGSCTIADPRKQGKRWVQMMKYQQDEGNKTTWREKTKRRPKNDARPRPKHFQGGPAKKF
jgi:hypothetical protein